MRKFEQQASHPPYHHARHRTPRMLPDTSITVGTAPLAAQILPYSFFDFMEANSSMPSPNSFFKNSGHVRLRSYQPHPPHAALST